MSTSRVTFTSLAVDPQNPNILYGTEDNGPLLLSVDHGSTWTPFYASGLRVAAPAPGRIYLLDSVQSDACPAPAFGFTRSLDGGQTWQHTFIACDDQGPDPDEQIFVNPSNPDQVFLSVSGQSHQTWISQDGGLTWDELLINGQVMGIDDMAFDPASGGRIFLANASIWWSADNGQTWNACGGGPGNSPFQLQTTHGNLLVTTFRYLGSQISASDVFRSDDQCASWWKSTTALPAHVNELLADPRSPGRLLAGTAGYGVFQSNNNGATWQESNPGLSSYAVISSLAVSASDPQVILAGGAWPRPGVYRSTDDGSTWNAQVFDQAPTTLDRSPRPAESLDFHADWRLFFARRSPLDGY